MTTFSEYLYEQEHKESFSHKNQVHGLYTMANTDTPVVSLRIVHDGKKWDVDGTHKSIHKDVYKTLKSTGVLYKLNQKWGDPSGDFSIDSQKGDFKYDHSDLTPVTAHLDANNKKYVQVKGLGFYHTGEDVAGLESPALEGKTQFHAERKNSKNGVLHLKLKDVPKSHHDLDAEEKK